MRSHLANQQEGAYHVICANSILGAELLDIEHCVEIVVDLDLLDGLANRILEEIVLWGDDHGRLCMLVISLDTGSIQPDAFRRGWTVQYGTGKESHTEKTVLGRS